jgi:hypothetical protein
MGANRSHATDPHPKPNRRLCMIRKVLPVLLLSAFVAAPVAAPAFAAGDQAKAKCEKIKDAKLKAQCLKDVSKQK